MNKLNEKLGQFLGDNIEELKDVVRELNGWDGSLEHLDAHHNDEEFFEVFFHGNPMEAVRASHYGEYEYTDDYVRFNGYGNLESLSEYEYEEELKGEIDDIIELLIEKRSHLHLSDELEELFEESEDED